VGNLPSSRSLRPGAEAEELFLKPGGSAQRHDLSLCNRGEVVAVVVMLNFRPTCDLRCQIWKNASRGTELGPLDCRQHQSMWGQLDATGNWKLDIQQQQSMSPDSSTNSFNGFASSRHTHTAAALVLGLADCLGAVAPDPVASQMRRIAALKLIGRKIQIRKQTPVPRNCWPGSLIWGGLKPGRVVLRV